MDLDFSNHIISVFNIGGYELLFTETMRNTLFVCAVMVVFAFVVRICLASFTDKPEGFQNVVEMLVETFSGMSQDSTGDKSDFYGSWFFSVFLFVILSNYSGLLGLRPPTASLSTTLALSLITFFMIHIAGILSQGGEYFRSYFDPFPVFFPMNILGAVSVPISLSFRLFGNILGGMIIMEMVHGALPAFLRPIIPIPLHLYFDIFSGAVQAVIFTMLSLLFIGDRLPEKDYTNFK